MTNTNQNKGMNGWDFTDKNKYLILVILAILILIIIIFTFRGYSVETPYFKIGKVPDTLIAEIPILSPPETIYQEKIKIVEKPVYTESKKPSPQNKDTEIGTQINADNNQGTLIGTLNIGPQKRLLTDNEKVFIKKNLDEYGQKLGCLKSCEIEIKYPMNDPNAEFLYRQVGEVSYLYGYEKIIPVSGMTNPTPKELKFSKEGPSTIRIYIPVN